MPKGTASSSSSSVRPMPSRRPSPLSERSLPGRSAGTNGRAYHRAASSFRRLCRRWSQPRSTDMRGRARWPDRGVASHRRHRRRRRATGVPLRDLGDHYLKDISRPQRLFQIDADGLPSEFPRLGARTIAGARNTALSSTSPAGAASCAKSATRRRRCCGCIPPHRRRGGERERWEPGRARRGPGRCASSLPPGSAIAAAAAIRSSASDSDWIRGTEKPGELRGPCIPAVSQVARLADCGRRRFASSSSANWPSRGRCSSPTPRRRSLKAEAG